MSQSSTGDNRDSAESATAQNWALQQDQRLCRFGDVELGAASRSQCLHLIQVAPSPDHFPGLCGIVGPATPLHQKLGSEGGHIPVTLQLHEPLSDDLQRQQSSGNAMQMAQLTLEETPKEAQKGSVGDASCPFNPDLTFCGHNSLWNAIAA